MSKFYAALVVAMLSLAAFACMVTPPKAAEATPVADEEAAPPPEAVPQSIVPRVPVPTSPVVRIINEKGGTFCTGFLIAPRYIATAGHCLVGEGDNNLRVQADNGIIASVSIAAYSDADFGQKDFGLLFMTDLEARKWQPAKLDCSGEVYPVGTAIYTKGFPALSNQEVYVEGYLSGAPLPEKEGSWTKPVYPAILPIYYGHSGSPVWIKDTGEVFGILVGTEPDQRAYTYIQPIKPICEALNG